MGCFELGGLPIGERLLVTWSLDGYMPIMRTVVSGSEPIGTLTSVRAYCRG
jgi:hypothetical protein